MRPFNPQDIDSLHAQVRKAQCITVTVHTHPDGDAVGSGLALVRFLCERGKDAALVLPDPVPGTLAFMLRDNPAPVMDGETAPEACRRRIGESDVIFCLDHNRLSRTETLAPALEAAAGTRILIDHHLDPEQEAFSLRFSETEVSSTCELLYRLLLTFPGTGGTAFGLSGGVRTLLMTGLTTDTNNFANSVWPGTLEMASELLEAGTDRDAILTELYNRYRENRFRLMGHLLSERMEITPEGAAIIVVDRELQERFGILEGETEGFVNLPLGIDRVRISFFLKEENGLMRVSIRSERGVSAQRCAREWFHGGGHPCAAGGKLTVPADLKDLKDTADYVRRVAREFLKDDKR